MNGVIDHRATAALGGVHKPVEGARASVGGTDGLNLADFACADPFNELGEGGGESAWKGGHELNTGVVTGFDQSLALFSLCDKRLFAKNMPAGGRGGHAKFGVVDIGTANHDCIANGEQFIDGGSRSCPMSFCKSLASLGNFVPDSNDLSVGMLFEGVAISPGVHVGNTQKPHPRDHCPIMTRRSRSGLEQFCNDLPLKPVPIT